MSLADKFNIPAALLQTIKNMNEGKAEYQAKVKALMAKRGIKSLADLSPEEKKDFFNTLDSMHKAKNEEVELEEGKSSTGYELYHKDFSSAMQHAYDFAKKKYNIEIDPTEIDRNVAMGPRKPSSGKANAYRLLDKTGKKAIQVQVTNLDNKRYELNMYKEDVDLEEGIKPTLFNILSKGEQINDRIQKHMDAADFHRDQARKVDAKDPNDIEGYNRHASLTDLHAKAFWSLRRFKESPRGNHLNDYVATHKRIQDRYKKDPKLTREEVEQIDEISLKDRLAGKTAPVVKSKYNRSKANRPMTGKELQALNRANKLDLDKMPAPDHAKDYTIKHTGSYEVEGELEDAIDYSFDILYKGKKVGEHYFYGYWGNGRTKMHGHPEQETRYLGTTQHLQNWLKTKSGFKGVFGKEGEKKYDEYVAKHGIKKYATEEVELEESKSKESKDKQKQKPLTPAEKKDLSKISGIMAKQRKQLSRLREEEELTESHFKVGDEVVCKKSGMEGEVVKVDEPQVGKYYTVKQENGKMVKYAPDELKKEDDDEDEDKKEKEEVEEAKDEGASKDQETKFHKKLDTLVHKTFGKRPEEMKEETEQVDEVLDTPSKALGYMAKATISGLKSGALGTGKFRKRQAGVNKAIQKTKAKIAKMNNEEVEELDEGMSASQIKTLRDAYAKIEKIDVSGQPYKNLVAFLDKQDLKTLKMLAGAKIKFISGMAQNRVVRKMNEDIDEGIGSTIGGALGQYAGSKMGLEGPGRVHGEVLGRQLEMFARAMLKKLKKEELEHFENESEELTEDLMKLDPITNTLVAAAVGIGITMSTLKYWFGPREDLRKPIEKGLDKAKKDGNAKLYHSLAAKYWEDIANDYQKKLDSLRKNPESVYKKDNPKTGAKAGDLKKFERLMQDEFIKDIKRYKEKAKEFSAKERSGEPISKKYYESFEHTQIDEVSADAAKRVAQRRDQDFRKGTPTETQKRRMGRGDWRADPQLHADKARQSAEKRGAKDVYDYNKKEEVEFDEASNPQISMKRAGLSVDRAKEVMRHQKEIGTIRKKREALRNSFDPSIIEAYKKMKNKKKEVTKDDNQIVKSSDKLSGKQEPVELEPELKEQKT